MTPPRDPDAPGFSLLELLLGLLLGVALAALGGYAWVRQVDLDRVAEGRELIGALQAAQARYFQRTGRYCDAPRPYPALRPDREPLRKAWDPPPGSCWQQLGVRPASGGTYFRLEMRASTPPGHEGRERAPQVGIPVDRFPGEPSQPWFYLFAEADLDGDGAPYTELRVSSTLTHVWSERLGE